MTRLVSSMLVAMLCVTGACSTSGKGSATPETAASESARRPGLVRPDTLPTSEPSMQREMPVLAAPVPDTATGDRATVARLEREARALARTTGCTSVSQCRTAPLGWRACGGPRDYVVYCAAGTDTSKLLGKLRELERVERRYLEKAGMMGTCDFRAPPGVGLMGGRCEGVTKRAGNEVPQ